MENTVTIIILLISLLSLSKQEKIQELNLEQSSERLNRGKAYLTHLEAKAKLPTQSECWRNAIRSLKSSCGQSNDEGQSYLAVKLTNCHLRKSGLKTFPCEETDSIETCTKPMTEDSISYIVYTEFFTHVSDVCFYLQNELWREETSKTITKLTMVSSNMARKLNESIQQQDSLLQGQDLSLKNQKEIMKTEQYLKSSLQDSAETVQNSFAKIREEAKLQSDLYSNTFKTLFESVEKLTKLQNMLLGEFMSLQSVAFYIMVVASCYLFTSTPRTAGARLPLFLLLVVMIFIERGLTSFTNFGSSLAAATTEDFHRNIWFIRKLFLLAMTLVFGYIVLSYTDLNKINNQMLQSIEHHILEIKRMQLTHLSTPLQLENDGSNTHLNAASKHVKCRKRLMVKDQVISSSQSDASDVNGMIVSRSTEQGLLEYSDCEDGTMETPKLVEKINEETPCEKNSKDSVKTKSSKARYVQKKQTVTSTTVRYSLRQRGREPEVATPHIYDCFLSGPGSEETRKLSSKKRGRKGKSDGPRPFFSSDEED